MNGNTLRSSSDTNPVTITFSNESSWNVLLLWYDYEGRCVLYASIRSGRTCSLFSFLTHPWVAVDAISFCPMSLTVSGQTDDADADPQERTSLCVFIPSERYLSSQQPSTISVSIKLPVLSLADLCKRRVQTMLPPDCIRQLDLPQLLINTLLRPLTVPWDRLATNRT
ncbi:hypothetical protein CSKR_201212 [Clonorchis sinensis]|uniref:Uncharacterized protein n=2 Tax=Clonorchis sinensis TaxID=79923 RepID=A0A8T1MNE2_CLOSI|nr:hypothetical protein CSKR_201212 [Clonorchis sinensis]GAA56088.1 von Hippel-lindau disease tumor supressor [Clonorchis sinensis]